MDSLSSLQILAQCESGVPTAVFDVLFADEDAKAVYDRVYDQSPITFEDDEGNSHTHYPSAIFGVIG